MARRIVLHVGLMKSGTSFVQQVLKRNKETLLARDVLFPGTWNDQVRAVKDVIDHGGPGQPPLAADGTWRTLWREVEQHPGTAVVSMEFLGPRRPSKVRQIVESLPAAEVTVVVSVRDLARTIPAMWQEHVQNWGHIGWDDYLDGVENDPATPPGKGFWDRQDAPRIVGAWADVVGAPNVTVLTVPPSGAPKDLLWRRFAEILGIDAEGIGLDVPSNPSLGVPSLLVLQRLNDELREADTRLTPKQYERTVKQLLAKKTLAERREPKLGLDTATTTWVAERGERDLELLRGLGVPVVGDLDELRCRPVPGAGLDDVDLAAQLDAAIDALAVATAKLARLRAREQKRR